MTKKKAEKLDEALFDDILDSVEKDLGLMSTSNINGKRVSTTLAAVDIILGGGLVPGGWYTFAGAEQSSKTTLATTVLTSLAIGEYATKVPVKAFFDYEGSFSHDYLLNQAETLGFKGKATDIFGIIDPKTEKYVTRPVVRKYSEQIGEKFFDYIAKLERLLPDKEYRNGSWWLVYEDNKKNKHLKDKADPKKYKNTGKFWIETDNPYPQAVIVVDSYPGMLPKVQDVDDPNNAIATQARMFADQIKRVKGRMAPKKIIILGMNIMRKVPMAMFGPTEEEAGGTALRQFSDVRLKMTSRSSVFGMPKGKIEKEPSVTVEGRSDYYRYVNIKTIKNKLSVPDLETWVRIWIRDGNGKARGYCPVFDSWYFLTQIGAAKGGTITASKKRVTLNLKVIGIKDWPEKPKVISWLDFKSLILGDKKTQLKVLQSCGYKGKGFSLRSKIQKLGNDPNTFDLFIKAEANKEKSSYDD